MKKELEDKLFEKNPKIFRQKELSSQETAMCWGITCGDGWFDFSADLSSYAGEDVIVRFAFGSDPAYSTIDAAELTGFQVEGEVDNTPFIQQFISASREKGLLTLRSGANVLRLAPPLIVSEAEIDKAISIIIDIANYLSTKTGD